MAPERHFCDGKFLSLFFPFSRPQELSNEPHIVWFWGLLKFTSGTPKCPFLTKIFYEIFRSREEFWAIRRLSATSVSLSNPKTALDQSEAVKIILDFLTLSYTEQKILQVQRTRKKISAQIFLASNSHFRMHFSEGGVVKDWSNIAIFCPCRDIQWSKTDIFGSQGLIFFLFQVGSRVTLPAY